MKKRFVLFILMILVSTAAFSWDEDDNLDNTAMIGWLKYFVFDLSVNSPMTLDNSINFRTGYLLGNNFTLGVVGNFSNFLNNYTKTDNTDKQFDTTVTPWVEFISRETKNESFYWQAINNTLDVYLGYKVNDDVYIGVTLGGGSNFTQYDKEDKSDTLYDNNKNKLATSSTTLSETINGRGLLRLGVGTELKGGLFNTSLINYMDIRQLFTFQVGGNNGSIKSKIVTLNADEPADDKTTVSKNYKKDYFGFVYWGDLYMELQLHKVADSLSSLNRFNFLLGLNYSVGTRAYTNAKGWMEEDITDQSLNTGTDLSSVIKRKYDTFLSDTFVGLTLGIDVRPLSNVQMRIRYQPKFTFTGSSYKQDRTDIQENNLTKGVVKYGQIVNKSYVYSFDHVLDIRLRFLLESIPVPIRWTMGVKGTMTHGFTTVEQEKLSPDQTSNTVKATNITTTTFTANSYKNPVTTTHAIATVEVAPVLAFDIEIVKGYAVIETAWKPVIAITTNGDSNVFNLANWSIAAIIRFDPNNITE